jgi:hypothetical protein
MYFFIKRYFPGTLANIIAAVIYLLMAVLIYSYWFTDDSGFAYIQF